MGEKRKEIERENKEERVRVKSPHFSLDFSAIGPSNLGETKGKVNPHCNDQYQIIQVFNKFDQV